MKTSGANMCSGAVDVTPETAAAETPPPDVAGAAFAHAGVGLGGFDRAQRAGVAPLRAASTAFGPRVLDAGLANGCNA